MRETIRDYIYHMSSGTIAGLCGSPRYADIDAAVDAAIEKAENLGILESYDWTPRTIAELFKKEVA